MNMYNEMSFGEFIAKKREEKKITLREMARLLKITPPYLSDIEKERRNPPDKDKLDELANILSLSEDECRYMYDLAGKKRNSISVDLPDYIMERDYVRVALRKAMDLEVGEEEWKKFIEELENRKG
ncbi:helix-turn-helix domain-containing protein [Clostridium celatum]|uniref:DNA-binding helix-turn-helix protein n=1 Tax=Clostridium celatum DSM 1785 TaxID=545697 RepID=L1QJF3_9CLOT|nr:helix-turn-helix transcriptional regulator [Clostridium celatum]EKY28108.1 DNA-binding helix-turn-helix protein [Clostridium celatum DSM 1785]MCE9654130.1 helix-turn-helix domain-containing protein [Clostridium celatum]